MIERESPAECLTIPARADSKLADNLGLKGLFEKVQESGVLDKAAETAAAAADVAAKKAAEAEDPLAAFIKCINEIERIDNS